MLHVIVSFGQANKNIRAHFDNNNFDFFWVYALVDVCNKMPHEYGLLEPKLVAGLNSPIQQVYIMFILHCL